MQHCTEQQAIKLREIGFNIETESAYNIYEHNVVEPFPVNKKNWNVYEIWVSRPYIYEALDWVRDNHGLSGDVESYFIFEEPRFNIFILNLRNGDKYRPFQHPRFSTHPKALTALLDAILERI